jgi:hypothetical protein
LETREELTNPNLSSRYKLCTTSNNTSKIEFKNKIPEHLEEIPEVKEHTYIAKAKKKVFSGAKFVYDRCEIL